MANSGRFKKGNPGKPKGAVMKSTKLIKDIFADAFEELQKDKKTRLTTWGRENPTEFYKLASKLIPVQLANDPDNPLTTSLPAITVIVKEPEED